MSRRRFVFERRLHRVLLWMGVLAGFSLEEVASVVAQTPPPNIVLILADDMGWPGTSVQLDPNVPGSKSDYYQTPNLERLASEGMRFSNAYAASPMCSPSRVAIFTGLSPAQAHMTDVIDSAVTTGGFHQTGYRGQPLTPPIPFGIFDEDTTFAERLGEYKEEYSKALYRKDHVGSSALVYGFDDYDFHQSAYTVDGEDPYKLFATANHASDYMQQRVNQEQPFVLMLTPNAIHAPIEYTTESYNEALATPIGEKHKYPPFYAATKDLDTFVGMVMDKLDDLGIADNTYLFFTSDNGATSVPLNNSPLYGAKGSLWEGGIRVPFFAKGPGIQADSTSDVPIVAMDLFATITDLAGVTAPLAPNVESASLVPVLHNGGQLPTGTQLQRAYGPNGELFFHYPHYSNVTTPASAVRDGNYKLVKMYGQNGAADQLLLFDLSQNLSESINPNSPLNLASQLPQKTSELLGKLETWLAGVDASLPFNAADDVQLHWKADQNGELPSRWRSINRMHDMRSETWDVAVNLRLPVIQKPDQIPVQQSTQPYQQHLSKKAYHFDGDDFMLRPYFLVSDEESAAQNGDNSVSFDFWFRVDNLNPTKNKVLFESGDGSAGLSLTLGDADADGKSNDLRFRVLSASGESMTTTVPIDQFADPTRDFIHATAVLDDTDGSRALNLYINGYLASHIVGMTGIEHRLDWDGLDTAGLGLGIGVGLGGAGGTGPQPFAGGFAGDIAEMRFYNYAIDSAQVQQNYNSSLSLPGFGVSGVSGDVAIPSVRPTDVTQDLFESDLIQVIHERSDTRTFALPLDSLFVAGATLASSGDLVPGAIDAGTTFNSYLVQLDPTGSDSNSMINAAGSITFEGSILGIILDSMNMADSDSLLASIGNFGDTAERGLVLGTDGQLTFSLTGHELSFDLSVAGDEMLQFRVLTSYVPPFAEPITADFNGDLIVDDQDLLIWKSSFGIDDGGDTDEDGDTDGTDFLNWQRQFGAQVSASTFAAVPEPSTILQVALLFSLSLSRRGNASRLHR